MLKIKVVKLRDIVDNMCDEIDLDEDLSENLEYESIQITNFSHNDAEVQIPVWKTKDGTFVQVPDMTDTHLTNSIKYLERKAIGRAIVKNRQYHNMLELATETYQAYGKNIYLNLVEEAINRGIIILEKRMSPNGTIERYRKWMKEITPESAQQEPPHTVRKIIL